MREILFRGKRLDTGEWAEGDLIRLPGSNLCSIACHRYTDNEPRDVYAVDAETVGQLTGLKDKNGKDIYEGDVLIDGAGDMCQVVFKYAESQLECPSDEYYRKIWEDECEVIGSIHDNPDLLKTQQS